MRKASFIIFLCWVVFAFLLYLGYGESYGLPPIVLPIEYAHLPKLITTVWSETALLISGLMLAFASYATYSTKKRKRTAKTVSNKEPYKKVDKFERIQRKRKVDYYSTPGTYEIREARPHKYQERKPPSKTSWDREIDDWVKKRK